MKKAVLVILFLIMFFLIKDFIAFIDFAYAPNDAIEDKYEAVVVLTGGTGRIDKAVELMEHSKAKTLFISGVNENVSLADLKKNNKIDKAFKLELGYAARNTYGNAVEIENFIVKNEIKNLIMVTSAYHLPRAVLELDEVTKKAKVMPYRVFENKDNNEKWWQNKKVCRLLITEYGKYFITRLRKKYYD